MHSGYILKTYLTEFTQNSDVKKGKHHLSLHGFCPKLLEEIPFTEMGVRLMQIKCNYNIIIYDLY